MADGAFPQELKTQIEGFHKTLTSIREKQDELDKEVKKRGAADPLTAEQIKRIEKEHDRLRDDINQVTKEVRRKAAVSTSDAASSRHETKANNEFARWLGISAAGMAVYSDQAAKFHGSAADLEKASSERVQYKAAFQRWLRYGEKMLTPAETKALSVGSGPDGGNFVEPFRAQSVIDKLYETSDVRGAGAMQITITSSSYKEPIDRDEPTTGWVGEVSTRSETNTPQVGWLEIPVHEQYALPKATQNLLDDAGIDVEAWLDQKVIDEMGRQENAAFVNGNGVNKPRGFTQYTAVTTADSSRTFGQVQYVGTGASGAFKTASSTVNPADDILDLIHKFKKPYRKNLRLGGSRLTLGAIRKFKDTSGNYNIYAPVITPQAGIIDTVLGYAWDEFADMADYSTSGALGVVAADWSRAYLIVDRAGIRQMRDPYTSKGYVLFYTTKRVGGGIRDSDAIKFIKFS